MTHPEDLLAAYVDGTLGHDERAVVDAHLASCGRCRGEIEDAARALEALAEVREEPVPLGVTGPVLAEARRTAPRRRPERDRYRWAAGLAAAAGVLLVAAVLGPRLFGGSLDDSGGAVNGRAPSAEQAPDTTLGGAAERPPLEVLDRDLDDRDLERLAKRTAVAAPALPEPDPAATLEAPDDAVSCLLESGATIDDRDVVVRLIEARYLGSPVYVGVFHEGSGGGGPPEKVVVWVVSSRDCSITTLLSRTI